MPKVTLVLTKENDDWLRSQMRRHGDLSKIVNALIDKARKSESK